jgi:undecaprenyl phosphate N,N'-diacetylbacillosamine 1-phosphate transferase
MKKLVKRLLDISISIFALVLFLPLWIVIAIIIKLTSKGPVFFIQERPGMHRKIIKVFKFRTMKLGSETMIKGIEVYKDDSRVTKFGKLLRRTKLDEIPQLINILLGSMSLIGPRPERISSLLEYDDNISKRLNMKPGISGLAQVSGNIYLTLKDRYLLDIYYVEHFSLWLDLKIFVRTVFVVIFGEDRYKDKPLIKMK